MTRNIISFLIILAYLVITLAITVIHGRRKKADQTTAEGFFLASRGVSAVLLPLTMIAAMQSTFAFLGAPGMFYSHGISYIVIVLSQVWVALMVIYFGNKIRKLSKKHGYMSIGDYFEDRYQSKYLKILASIISVLMTMIFLSMQYVGNARAISLITNNLVSYNLAIFVSVVFSLGYVLIGGASGVVLIDAVQAIVLMVGIIISAYIALGPVGGIQALFTKTMETAPELLSRPGPKGLYSGKYWIMQFIVLPFGIWLCPHIWSRSLMANDEKALARSAISIPVSQVLIYGFSTLFVGLAGHQLLGDIGAADNVLPLMMKEYSNWIVAALIMAAAIAAGISTINAMLLASAQIVSQDLVLLNKRNKVSDKDNIRLSRTIVLVIAVICGLIAMSPPETLVQVVTDVAYTGLAQLAPPFVLGLYWKKMRKEGAVAGLTVGIVTLFALRIFNLTPLNFPGFMWAFFSNLILCVVISLIMKEKDNSYVEERFFVK